MSDNEKNIPEGWEVRTSRSTGKLDNKTNEKCLMTSTNRKYSQFFDIVFVY